VGTQDQIVELLVSKYGVDAAKVSPDATMADLGLDSLSVAELAFDIEDRFSIQIPTEEGTFKTFGEAVALVDRFVQAKAASAT
jgi:acyl carrier protein